MPPLSTHDAVSVAPADAALRRRALLGLTLTYLLNFGSMGIQLPFTALAMKGAGLGPAVIGLMWAARSLTGAFSPLVFGVIADRLGGARPLLIAALIAGVCVFTSLSLTSTPFAAVLAFACYGVFANPANSLVDGMLLTTLGKDAASYGRYRAVGTVGFGTSAVLVSVALEHGWLAPTPAALFPICAILSSLAVVVVVVVVPTVPRPALSGLGSAVAALKQPVLLGLLVAGSLLWASHAGYVSFLSPLAEAVGLPATVGFAVAGAVVVEAVAMPMAPLILRRITPGTVLVLCAATATLRWLLTPWATTPTTFTLVNGLHGITFGLFFVVIVGVIAQRVPPTLRQTSQGLLSSLSLGIGGVVGGLGVGTLLERGSSAATVWWSMAVLAALSTVLLVPVARRLKTWTTT